MASLAALRGLAGLKRLSVSHCTKLGVAQLGELTVSGLCWFGVVLHRLVWVVLCWVERTGVAQLVEFTLSYMVLVAVHCVL